MSRFPTPVPARPFGSGDVGEETGSADGSDSLDAFRTETADVPPPPVVRTKSAVPPPRSRTSAGQAAPKAPPGDQERVSRPPQGAGPEGSAPADHRIAAIGGVALLALIALVAVIVLYAAPRSGAGAAETGLGTASIDSYPPGAEVVVDGELQGTTPLSFALPSGEHLLEVRDGATSRSIPLIIEAGTRTAQYVELAPSVLAPATGRLEVTSDPPGAQVTLDGVTLGTTPLAVDTLDVGEHQVRVAGRVGVVSRDVTIEPGATATVMVSLTGAASAAGWLSIQAPIALEIFENGRLVGTTDADQIMLPAGAHDLELVNSAFEFRTTIRTQIAPGGTATESIAVPNGSLSINALPWAEVYVDGSYAGTTPLGNLAVPVGSHEVVWRHPELGERRRIVEIPSETPTRIGVDFNQ